MVEAIEIILCCIGACAVIGMIIVWIADIAKTHAEERRIRQRQLEKMSKGVDEITEIIRQIKEILNYK